MCFFRTGLILLVAIAPTAASGESPNRHVDPLIGTDDMGHTYPGATVPFGLVQLIASAMATTRRPIVTAQATSMMTQR
jgi:putative alpha-1,2-mannosidase